MTSTARLEFSYPSADDDGESLEHWFAVGQTIAFRTAENVVPCRVYQWELDEAHEGYVRIGIEMPSEDRPLVRAILAGESPGDLI